MLAIFDTLDLFFLAELLAAFTFPLFVFIGQKNNIGEKNEKNKRCKKFN